MLPLIAICSLPSWVKTKGVAGPAMGALFNVHQLQKLGLPKPLKGDNDWTQLAGEFSSGDQASITINMLFGGWGRSKGEAWYDDVQLIELGPAAGGIAGGSGGGGKLAEIVSVVTRHYAEGAPVTSIVATPFLWLFGESHRAAQVPFVLAAAALVPGVRIRMAGIEPPYSAPI